MSNESLKTALAEKSKEPSPMQNFNSFLLKKKDQLAAALPKHITSDRMIRIVMTNVQKAPKLLQCSMESVWGSIITASQLGLEPGVLGQGYLIPYKGICTFVPGWQGLVDLASRSGRCAVWTGAVFEGDAFDWSLGDDPYIKHQPCGEDDPRLITHVYAVGRVKGSDWPVIEVWSYDRVWRHRDKYNKVGTDHYSYKNEEMYARKVVLLQVLKYMPKSIELTAALTADTAAESGQSSFIDGDYSVVDSAMARHEDPGANMETGSETEQETGSTPKQPEAGAADPHGLTQAGLIATMRKRTEVETLDADATLITSLPEDQQDEARQAYYAARALLTGELPTKPGKRQSRIPGAGE